MIGIYIIRNKINGKVYIGQSWNIEKRWKYHKTNCHNIHLKRAIEKYGLENFTFEMLKDLNETALTQLILNNYEEHFIEKYNSMNPDYGYNKMTGGSNGKPSEETKKKNSESHRGKIVSDETRKKMSESNKNPTLETRRKMSESRMGKKRTDETRKKISEGNKGKIVSDETKKKIGENSKGNKYHNKKIICLETNIIYNSQKEASDVLNIGKTTISNVCNGKRKTTGGMRFKFYVEIDIPA